MENISKRERSTNFSKNEVRLLTALVANLRTIIENKKTDAVTNKEKEAAWKKIAVIFNAATGLTARSSKSLKLKYESIKKETKKTMAKHRQELYKTGGGPSSGPHFTEVEEKVMGICSNITGLDARHDSDNIQEPIPKSTRILPTDNTVIVECNVDDPLNLESDDIFFPQNVLEENSYYEIENEKETLTTHQPVQVQDMEDEESHKENNWSSWNPKALKSKLNPKLKSPGNQKISKERVTAKLDALSNARLELVQLQREIAMKEHEFVSEQHKQKMLSMQNDEQRKQEIHEIHLRQLSNRVHFQTDIIDINK